MNVLERAIADNTDQVWFSILLSKILELSNPFLVIFGLC